MPAAVRVPHVRAARPVRARLVAGLVGGLVLGALGGASCAAGTTAPLAIDGAKLEQNIKTDASATELKLAKVECPRDRAAKADDTFTCSATVEAGGTLNYDVRITSERGEYRYQLAPGQVVDGTHAAALLTADIASAGPAVADVKVTCPTSIVAPGGRSSFDCTLTAAGGSARITVTSERGKPLDWTYRLP